MTGATLPSVWLRSPTTTTTTTTTSGTTYDFNPKKEKLSQDKGLTFANPDYPIQRRASSKKGRQLAAPVPFTTRKEKPNLFDD